MISSSSQSIPSTSIPSGSYGGILIASSGGGSIDVGKNNCLRDSHIPSSFESFQHVPKSGNRRSIGRIISRRKSSSAWGEWFWQDIAGVKAFSSNLAFFHHVPKSGKRLSVDGSSQDANSISAEGSAFGTTLLVWKPFRSFWLVSDYASHIPLLEHRIKTYLGMVR